MKQYFLWGVLAFILWVSATPMNAWAEDNKASIAIVDVRSLLTESKAAKTIQKQVKDHRDKFVKSLGEEEKSLRSMEKKLIEDKEKISAEEFAKKRRDFEKKLLETRKKAEERRRALEKAAAEASAKLRKEITDIVQDIADKKGYDLVLSAQNVVVGANSLNISKEVMDALNDEVSKISVDVK